MEAFGIYILKVTALITVFYLAYHVFLRKETFFNANRGYLLLGLFTSVLLPLISITKIIWVEPDPIASIAYNNYAGHGDFVGPMLPMATADTGFQLNYHYLLSALYLIGIVLLALRFISEYLSLRKIIEKPKAVTRNNFHFIDTEKVQSPFSFFNYIVYNSKLLQQDELSDIIEHEKIHSRQKHSADMLIAQTFCIFFWFNPIIWIYKKAMAQNLEFIADAEATKVVNDIKAYQKTLVKVTMQTQCIAITNHFYQSLIKKRIVMLNTNQSRKRNLWKYLIILPLLAFFIMQFQVQILAQEKSTSVLQPNNTAYVPDENITVIVDKNTTDEQLKNNVALLKNEYDITLKYSKVKRNKLGEITRIKIEYKDKEGNNGITRIEGDDPINPIRFIKKTDSNGKIKIGFSSDAKAQAYAVENETKPTDEANDATTASEDQSFGDYLSDLIGPPSPPSPPTPPSVPGAPAAPLPPMPSMPPMPLTAADNSSSVIIKNGKVTTSSKKGAVYINGAEVFNSDDAKEITRKALEDTRIAMEKAKPEIRRATIEAMKSHNEAMKEHDIAMKAREEAMKVRNEAIRSQDIAMKAREEAMKARVLALQERDIALKAAAKEREQALKAALKEREAALKTALKEREKAFKAAEKEREKAFKEAQKEQEKAQKQMEKELRDNN